MVSLAATGRTRETGAIQSQAITVTLSDSSALAVSVDYTITPGTATTADYSGDTTGTISIPAGSTTATINLDISGDSLYEADETIDIQISKAINAIIDTTANSQIFTIANDDSPPTIAFFAATSTTSKTAESEASISFDVAIDTVSGLDTFVDYTINYGTASSNDLAENTSTSGTINISAGSRSQSLTIALNDDSLFELDESVDIDLSNPVNAALGTNVTHTATITSTDAKPSIQFATASSSIVETDADQTVDIAVNLSTASGAATSIDYIINYGTADSSADANDVTADSLTLVIPAGQSTGNIALKVVGDDSFELNEVSVVRLSTSDNATVTGITDHVLTISNDDTAPTLSLAATGSVAESNATQSQAITVSLSGTSVLDVSVDYTITSGTATTADYSGDTSTGTGTLFIAAGGTTATINLDISGDSLYEADETIDIQISKAINATIDTTANSQIFTITNDDSPPTIAFSKTTSSTVESASISVDVTIDTVSGLDASVDYIVTFKDATTDDITGATTGSIVIPAGSTKQTLTIALNNDNLFELDESVDIDLSNPVNAALGTNVTHTATITSIDAKPSVQFATASSSIAETDADQTVDIAVNLSTASGAATSIDYIINYGTADSSADANDITADSLTLVIPAGQSTGNIALQVVGDDSFELDEVSVVSLGTSDNATITGITNHVLTISNDDTAPTLSLAATDSVIESNATQSQAITVRLSGTSVLDVSVDYTITSGTATTADYSGDTSTGTGTLFIAAGGTTATINLDISGDSLYEADETIDIQISTAINAIIDTTANSQIFTITNDDNPPTIAFSKTTSSTAESASISVDVTIDTVSGLDASVDYIVTFIDATTDDITGATTGSIVIPAGSTTQTLTIALNDDSLFELDESVDIGLSNPVNAALGTNVTHTATITSIDAKPSIQFATASSSIAETDADQTVDIAVNLSTASGTDTSIDYIINYGTADSSADANDVTADSLTLVIPAGQIAGNIALQVAGDDSFELNEVSVVRLSTSDNATITGITNHVLTISNDDTAPTLSLAATDSVIESNATQSQAITVRLSGTSVLDVSVDYTITSGTATTADYSGDTSTGTGTLFIAAGGTTATINLDISGDSLYEADETIDIQISTAINATIDTTANSQIFTITNDDSAPTIAFSKTTSNTAESASISVDVTIDTVSGLDASVDYIVTFIDATADDITGATTGSIVIPAGSTKQTLTIALNNDNLFELDESVDIGLSNPVNATLGTNVTHTATITSIDAKPSIQFATASSSISETDADQTVDIAVNLSTASGAATSIDYIINYGTADSSADANDVTADNLTLVIPAGQIAGNIALKVIGDDSFELNEVSVVSLSTSDTAIIDTTANSQIFTITNDDSPPTIAFSKTTSKTLESASISVDVTIDTVSGLDASVDYIVTFKDATTDDITGATTGSIVIPAGSTKQTLTIALNDDSLFELDESVDIDLSNPVNAALGTQVTHTATITSIDAKPSIQFATASSIIAETDADQTVDIAVNLSTASGAATSIDYIINYGTADSSADANDVTADNLTLVIPAGQSTGNIALKVIGDDSFELDEVSVVSLSTSDTAIIDTTANSQIFTITNDDSPPTIAFSKTTSKTLESASISVDVTIDTVSGLDASVDYIVTFKDATTDDITGATTGSIVIPAGSTKQTLTIALNDDSLFELDESVDIDLSNPVNAALGTNVTHTATITSRDAKPSIQFATASSSISETDADQTVDIAVNLSTASGAATSIDYIINYGTADSSADANDVTADSLTLVIPAGQSTGNIGLKVVGDDSFELNEVSVVRLSTSDNATVTGTTNHVLTISNDDTAPTLSLAATDSVIESNATQSQAITVSLSGTSVLDVSVDYTITSGTATTADYSGDTSTGTGTLFIAAGGTTATINLDISGDSLYEADETIDIQISKAINATIDPTANSQIFTITNDDSAPTIAFSKTTSKTLESASISVDVTIDTVSGLDASVDYIVTFKDATTDDITGATTGSIVIPAGSTTQTLTIALNNDNLFELDESVDIGLSNPVNATLGTNVTHTATITSADIKPSIQFATASSSIAETDADQTVDIAVNLSTASGTDTSIDYIINYGTADSSADANDVTADSLTLVIPAGQSTGNIALKVVGDDSFELDEVSVVSLGTSDNATVTGTTDHVLTISNDDTAPIVSFSDQTTNVSEGAGSTTIELTLTSAIGLDVTVDLAFGSGVADTSADAAADFTAPSASITISAGDTTADVTVTITDDATVENTEQSVVTIVAANNATPASNASHLLSILDNENKPPVVTSVVLNQAELLTAKDTVRVGIVATDADTNITHYLIKHTIGTSTTPTAPMATDPSWDSLSSAAMSVDTSVDYLVGNAPRDTYRFVHAHVWVRDTLGAVSAAVTASDDIEQTSAVLFADTTDASADPLIKYQWHLRNTGQANFGSDAATAGIDLNVQKTLTEYGIKGRGVLVNVIDSGLELLHEDMAVNIDADGGDDFNADGVGGADIDPTPVGTGGDHGTSVAGLIAMRDANGLGGVGVSPEATLIGHNYIDAHQTIAAFSRSIGADDSGAASELSDVINMSFGSSSGVIVSVNVNTDDLYQDRLLNGRNGNGTVFVKSAGNGYNAVKSNYDCTLANSVGQSCEVTTDDNANALPLIITAAVNAVGVRSSYSTAGAANFISGFGGESGRASNRILHKYTSGATRFNSYTNTAQAMVTTDVQGCSVGYSRSDYGKSPTADYIVSRNDFEYVWTKYVFGGNSYAVNYLRGTASGAGLTLNTTTPLASNIGVAAHSDNANCSYTSVFNGTSSAAPTVSGVVALMLQANPSLTHWDVRHILASTARKIDDTYDVTADVGGAEYKLSPGWITNAAGYNFSDWYGFGLVDADAAVEMALNYNVDAGITQISMTDESVDSGVTVDFVNRAIGGTAINIAVPDANTTGGSHSLHFLTDVTIDALAMYVLTTSSLQDTQIELTSPSGTTYVAFHAANGHRFGWNSAYSIGPTQRISVNAFNGENSAGNWTITVKDLFNTASGGSNGAGILRGWKLQIIGH